MIAFVKHYVGDLKMPPSKLILAFGVLLAPDLREHATEEDYLELLKMALSRASVCWFSRHALSLTGNVIDFASARSSRNTTPSLMRSP